MAVGISHCGRETCRFVYRRATFSSTLVTRSDGPAVAGLRFDMSVVRPKRKPIRLAAPARIISSKCRSARKVNKRVGIPLGPR